MNFYDIGAEALLSVSQKEMNLAKGGFVEVKLSQIPGGRYEMNSYKEFYIKFTEIIWIIYRKL